MRSPTAPPVSKPRLLLFEPRVEGHHLGWLRFITEDFLATGFQLSLALDQRPEAKGRIQDHMGELLREVNVVPVFDTLGRRRGDGKSKTVSLCLEQAGAERVFLCCFDEIASHCLRRAALGIYPPRNLRGPMGGIYHRPRFMQASRWSLDRFLKNLGLRRLLLKGWLRQLLFVDEYLAKASKEAMPGAPIFFLPDPCPGGFDSPQIEARRRLEVPLNKRVFLFYGGAYRRKGLHLAVKAMLECASDAAFLLCVGQQPSDENVSQGLRELVRRGRALVMDRYVSTDEEKLSFEAADVVLLPYLNHFGTSGVLSRAMAAAKMVIVSDEQLMGRLVKDHGLGLRFPSGDVRQLRQCIEQATAMPDTELEKWAVAARRYAKEYSRAAYRAALLKSFSVEADLSVANQTGPAESC